MLVNMTDISYPFLLNISMLSCWDFLLLDVLVHLNIRNKITSKMERKRYGSKYRNTNVHDLEIQSHIFGIVFSIYTLTKNGHCVYSRERQRFQLDQWTTALIILERVLRHFFQIEANHFETISVILNIRWKLSKAPKRTHRPMCKAVTHVKLPLKRKTNLNNQTKHTVRYLYLHIKEIVFFNVCQM